MLEITKNLAEKIITKRDLVESFFAEILRNLLQIDCAHVCSISNIQTEKYTLVVAV